MVRIADKARSTRTLIMWVALRSKMYPFCPYWLPLFKQEMCDDKTTDYHEYSDVDIAQQEQYA
jgi:hypothetical protein